MRDSPITDEMVEIMQGYAKAYKRALALNQTAELADLPHDERVATLLFAASLAQYGYQRSQQPELPEKMGPKEGMLVGDHLAHVLPLLAMSAGMIKSEQHMEDLISGMRPEEMPDYGNQTKA